jgi:hypothetical protein
MASQEDLGLGKLITIEQRRDAVHIAVAPVTASHPMSPGTHIAFVEGSTQLVRRAGMNELSIGIVDPFLHEPIEAGQRFWMWLIPGSITSLHHEWTHPAFERVQPATSARIEAAKAGIERIATEMGSDGSDSGEAIQYYGPKNPMTYHRLMAAAADWLITGDRLVQQGNDSWRDGAFPYREFWSLYEIVMGESVPEEKAGNFFCCTC